MLHPVNARWNASAADRAGNPPATAGMESMTVSSREALTLVEPGHSLLSTMGGTPSSGLYSADTAVMALAFIGAWLMLLGGAMLARQFNSAAV